MEAVGFDTTGGRARVDTADEASYWMRRIDGAWRIVGFGWLTDESIRALGGDWPEGAASEG